MKNLLGTFRTIAFLEGLSFVLLLGVAMPLKYIYDQPQAVSVIGMIHGLLFMIYTYLLIPLRKEYAWSIQETGLAFLASLLPLGTFVADYRWFRKIN